MFDLSEFSLPKGFRGRNAIVVQLWWLVQATAFSCSPQFMYGWRNFLLRMFGAKIGKNVIIRPSVKITYPWKLEVGENSWVGDNVELYTLGNIIIGSNTIISQKSYICAASHDYMSPSFDIWSKDIIIGDGVWIATDVFVAPGVQVGNGSVVGARSSVYKNINMNTLNIGSPAVEVKIIR